MKLTGSKLFSSVIFTLASTTAIAAPDLVEFSAGTPAKAEEVNSNFSNLKTFTSEIDGRVTVIENAGRSDAISSLQEKVTALEAVDHSAPVSALNNRVTPLENLDLHTALPALNNKVTALELVDHSAPITALTNRVAPLEILDLPTTLPTLQNKVIALEAVDHSAPITDLTNRIAPLEILDLPTALPTLQGKVTALENSDISAEILDLQTRVSALENTNITDEYSIPVYGDGILIGNTNRIPSLQIGGKMFIKTVYGLLRLKGDYNGGYRLASYNPHNDDRDDHYATYSDDQCLNPIFAVSPGEGNPLIFTKNIGVVDTAQIFAGETQAWIIEAGTTFNKTNTSFYNKNSGPCVVSEWYPVNTITIPMVNLNPDIHGLKHTYNEISINNYTLN